MENILKLAVITFVTPLAIIALISFVLHYFVALNSPPTQRAAWTAGLAYLGATLLLIFGGPPQYELYVPLAALPGGLIAFWYWRSDFRRGWIENVEALPDGAALANDDWGIGLLQLLALITLAIGVAVIRGFIRGSI